MGRSAEGGVDPAECPLSAQASFIRCLEVSVPLDHDDPGAGQITLAVAVVDKDDEVVGSPVVFLNGGPGGGIVRYASAFIGMPFDVVLVDLRGTGLSQPSLDCPGIDDAFVELAALPAGEESDARYDELLAQCRDRHLDAGVDFAAFDTAATAADVALLRTTLGYDEWNLWGSSYGTRVALAVLRDNPSGVRSVVLDATFPPDADFFGELPANAARSFEALVSACATDDECDDRFGDVEELITAVAADLRDEPVTVTAVRPVSGDRIEVLVDEATFWSILFDQLYDSRVIGRLPLLLERAADGDLSDLVQRFVDGRDPEVFEFSEALYDAVMCADEVPFIAPDVLDAGLEGRPGGFAEAFDTGVVVDDCEQYGLRPSPAVEDEPVSSDVPALLFTGRFDPVTPPGWTYRAAETLSNSTVVEMPARGHGLAIADPCTAAIMFEFLADPGAEPDLSCVEQAAPPAFEVVG